MNKQKSQSIFSEIWLESNDDTLYYKVGQQQFVIEEGLKTLICLIYINFLLGATQLYLEVLAHGDLCTMLMVMVIDLKIMLRRVYQPNTYNT